MKIKIRQGIFETNSSSTHSLSVGKFNISKTLQDIIMKYTVENSDTAKYYSNIENFISNDNTFILSSLELYTDDCYGCDYHIFIKSPLAKLAYVVHHIFQEIGYIECDLNNDDYFNYKGEHIIMTTETKQEKRKLIKSLEVCLQCVEDFIIEYSKQLGYENIEKVIIDKDDFETIGGIDEFKCEIPGSENLFIDFKTPITKSQFKSFIKKLMKDTVIIHYSKCTYSPYKSPIFKFF